MAEVIYGVGLTMDTLWNTQVGGATRNDVAYIFRPSSSSITRLGFYVIPTGYSGYGAGTGGTIRVTVEALSGGVPSGTALGTATFTGDSSQDADSYVYISATVTPGTLYAVVFRNIDASPTANFCSVDAAAWFGASTSDLRNPRWPNEEMRVVIRENGGSWYERPGHTPILDVTYADGSHSGQGYMEVERMNPGVISGTTSLVRERFTPSTSKIVNAVGVRVGRTSGSGNLVMSVKQGGSTLRSATVSASAVPVLSSTADASAGVWLSGSFADLTLAAGTTYDLELSTTGGVVLWTRGIQQGDGWGYNPATYFADGSLSVSTNSGGSWSAVSGLDTSGDLQFYFTLSGSEPPPDPEPPPPSGAAAHVQSLGSATTSSTGTSLSISTSKTVTYANHIIVGVGAYYDITPTSVTDNLGNTYFQVERTRRDHQMASLWASQVNHAGTLTTITVNYPSSSYVSMVAEEFSGIAGPPTPAGGLTGSGGGLMTWKPSAGTVNPGGMVVGVASSNLTGTHSAGTSPSGSPSTAIVLGTALTADPAISLAWAIAAGTAVTGLVGTTSHVEGEWAAAGMIFEAENLTVAAISATGAGSITVADRKAAAATRVLTGAGTVTVAFVSFVNSVAKQGLVVAGGGGTIAVAWGNGRTGSVTTTGGGSIAASTGTTSKSTTLFIVGAGRIVINNVIENEPIVPPLGGMGWGAILRSKPMGSLLIRAAHVDVEPQSGGEPFGFEVKQLTEAQLEGLDALIRTLDSHRD